MMNKIQKLKTFEVHMRSVEAYTVQVMAKNEIEAMRIADQNAKDLYEAEDAFEVTSDQ